MWFLSSGPGGDWRRQGPVEYKGNLYVTSICMTGRPSPLHPPLGMAQASQRLALASQRLALASQRLAQASQRLVKASQRLAKSWASEAGSGLREAGLGLSTLQWWIKNMQSRGRASGF